MSRWGILAASDLLLVAIGVVFLLLGLVQIIFSDRMRALYRRLNEGRSPGLQFWVGLTRFTTVGSGFLMVIAGLTFIVFSR